MKLLTIILLIIPMVNSAISLYKYTRNNKISKSGIAFLSIVNLLYIGSIIWLIRL